MKTLSPPFAVLPSHGLLDCHAKRRASRAKGTRQGVVDLPAILQSVSDTRSHVKHTSAHHGSAERTEPDRPSAYLYSPCVTPFKYMNTPRSSTRWIWTRRWDLYRDHGWILGVDGHQHAQRVTLTTYFFQDRILALYTTTVKSILSHLRNRSLMKNCFLSSKMGMDHDDSFFFELPQVSPPTCFSNFNVCCFLWRCFLFSLTHCHTHYAVYSFFTTITFSDLFFQLHDFTFFLVLFLLLYTEGRQRSIQASSTVAAPSEVYVRRCSPPEERQSRDWGRCSEELIFRDELARLSTRDCFLLAATTHYQFNFRSSDFPRSRVPQGLIEQHVLVYAHWIKISWWRCSKYTSTYWLVYCWSLLAWILFLDNPSDHNLCFHRTALF